MENLLQNQLALFKGKKVRGQQVNGEWFFWGWWMCVEC